MKRHTLAALYATHSWLGLVTGWLLFVVCLSGTLAVYKFELKSWSNPALVSVPAVDPLGPDAALAALLEHAPGVSPRLLAFPEDRFSIHNYSMAPAEGGPRYFLEPATGRIHHGLQSNFADFVRLLHANLFAGRWGRWFVGVLGITMLASLVLGVLVHRQILRDLFRLRLGRHGRQAWSDLHKFSGIWGLPFHLLIALTGAWLGLETLLISSQGPVDAEPTTVSASMLPVVQANAIGRQVVPGLTPTHVNWNAYGLDGSRVRVQGTLPWTRFVERGSTHVVIDAHDGEVRAVRGPTFDGIGARVLAMMKPLHFGDFAGRVGQLVYFVLGLASTALVLAGLLIWADRAKRLSHQRLRADCPSTMERANAGVMGGFILAMATMFVLVSLARVPSLEGAWSWPGNLAFAGNFDLTRLDRPVMPELVFFAAAWMVGGMALAWVRPIRAWRALAAATCALVLLVPLASAVGRDRMLDEWTRGAGEGGGLALVCIALAICSASIARRLHPGRIARMSQRET